MPNAHQKQYSLIKSTTTSHLWSGKSSLILLSFVILLHYVNNSLELSFWKLSDRFVLKNEESENTDPQGCSGPKFHSVKCVCKKDGTYPVQSQDSCYKAGLPEQKENTYSLGAPGWLSGLSHCLRLRSWSQGLGIESRIGLSAQQGACSLSLSLCLPLHQLVISLCQINK